MPLDIHHHHHGLPGARVDDGELLARVNAIFAI